MIQTTPASPPTPPGPAPRGQCRQCHYDLRGIESGRCPECGWPYELSDVLSTPLGKRLMKPTRWLAPAAIAIAALPLTFDALLLPTPLTLLLLFFLWVVVATPYIYRSRRRQRILFHRYPKHLLVDPDMPARTRIASIFLITAMLIWSGLWQRAVIYANLPWLDSYADQLYDKTPMDAPLPTARVWRGTLPVTPTWLDPTGVSFQVGFGTLIYSPSSPASFPDGYFPLYGWRHYSERTYTRISPAWSIERPPWNFLNPIPELNR